MTMRLLRYLGMCLAADRQGAKDGLDPEAGGMAPRARAAIHQLRQRNQFKMSLDSSSDASRDGKRAGVDHHQVRLACR